ncbi:MAG: hypothetical protein ACKVOE_07265 [Rickettsiales bacterium]
MADLETTQAQLRSTPTAGVSGEHSPYYRKLLSAGYKGYIQGAIGGSSLYGTLGLLVGAAVAIPAAFFVGPAVLIAIPAMAGLGAIHGAGTFADIGKTAAIIAESAESNEKRRYLLDRYYETPNDKEAAAIREILENQQKPRTPEKVFHWKTVMVGAAIGLALTAGIIWLGMPALGFELTHLLHPLTAALGHGAAVTALGGAEIVAGGVISLLGAAAGAMIGLDREYVRRWLDKSEGIVNDPSRLERELAEREREVQTLSQATKREDTIRPMLRSQADAGAEKINLAEPAMLSAAPSAQDFAARETPVSPRIIAGLQDAPATTISDVTAKDRVVNPQLAAGLS